MIDDEHKGIANILNLPLKAPVRKPKYKTQATPEITRAEILMNMAPLQLPKTETPVVKRDSYTDQYNKYFNTKSKSYYKNQTPKKKIGVLDYMKKVKSNYNDPGSERYVNKSLNKFENRTSNPSVVTFNPTTQLFTDATRNIAFKDYNQAKKWNDAVNQEPTATPKQVNDLKGRLDNSRAFGYSPDDQKETNRKQKILNQPNKNRRLI